MNNGTKIEKFRKIANHAIELTCNCAVDWTNTPRALFVRMVTVLLCCARDKDWDLKEEMHRIAKLTALYMRKHRAVRQTTEVTGRATSPDLLSD